MLESMLGRFIGGAGVESSKFDRGASFCSSE